VSKKAAQSSSVACSRSTKSPYPLCALANVEYRTGGSRIHGNPPYGRFSTLRRISSFTTSIWLARFSCVSFGARILSASRNSARSSAAAGSTSK